MKKYFFALLFFLSSSVLLLGVSIQFVRNYAQSTYSLKTVTYCSLSENSLKMDIYTPLVYAKPFPAIVYVHGGAWTTGARSPITPTFSSEAVLALVNKGFLVASIDYRLLPHNKFPAMIEDVKCSIRYLRAKSILYNIDPKRIGIMGHSAGGHLASLAGLVGKDEGWDKGEYSDQDSAVSAVVDLSGPTDLLKPDFYGIKSAQLLLYVLGTSDIATLEVASPVNHVSNIPGADPPFLIMHGNSDGTVNISQSIEFNKKLLDKKQNSTFITVLNANHSYLPLPTNAVIKPRKEELITDIVNFFTKYLGSAKLDSTPTIKLPSPTPISSPLLSPTPSVISSPTSAIDISPTGNIKIFVSVRLAGINKHDNAFPKHPDRKVQMLVYDESNKNLASAEGMLSYDKQGLFTGIVSLGSLRKGTYYIKLRLDNTLYALVVPLFRKLTDGLNILPITSFNQVDVDNDNKITLSDYNDVIMCFQKSICPNNLGDFNDDGVTDIIDYNILLNSFKSYIGD